FRQSLFDRAVEYPFSMEAVPGSAGSMVFDCYLPRMEMSGTVGLGASFVWVCLFCFGERSVDDLCAEFFFGGRCLLFYSRARHRRFFFSQEQCAPISAQRDLYTDHFSTDLYAFGCGARSV